MRQVKIVLVCMSLCIFGAVANSINWLTESTFENIDSSNIPQGWDFLRLAGSPQISYEDGTLGKIITFDNNPADKFMFLSPVVPLGKGSIFKVGMTYSTEMILEGKLILNVATITQTGASELIKAIPLSYASNSKTMETEELKLPQTGVGVRIWLSCERYKGSLSIEKMGIYSELERTGNLIPNGDFEELIRDFPKGWRKSPVDSSVKVEREYNKTGRVAVSLENLDRNYTGGVTVKSNYFPVSPNQEYMLTAWLAGEDIVAIERGAKGACLNVLGTGLNILSDQLFGDFPWQELKFRFKVGNVNEIRVDVCLFKATGRLFCDSVSLQPAEQITGLPLKLSGWLGSQIKYSPEVISTNNLLYLSTKLIPQNQALNLTLVFSAEGLIPFEKKKERVGSPYIPYLTVTMRELFKNQPKATFSLGDVFIKYSPYIANNYYKRTKGFAIENLQFKTGTLSGFYFWEPDLESTYRYNAVGIMNRFEDERSEKTVIWLGRFDKQKEKNLVEQANLFQYRLSLGQNSLTCLFSGLVKENELSSMKKVDLAIPSPIYSLLCGLYSCSPNYGPYYRDRLEKYMMREDIYLSKGNPVDHYLGKDGLYAQIYGNELEFALDAYRKTEADVTKPEATMKLNWADFACYLVYANDALDFSELGFSKARPFGRGKLEGYVACLSDRSGINNPMFAKGNSFNLNVTYEITDQQWQNATFKVGLRTCPGSKLSQTYLEGHWKTLYGLELSLACASPNIEELLEDFVWFDKFDRLFYRDNHIYLCKRLLF